MVSCFSAYYFIKGENIIGEMGKYRRLNFDKLNFSDDIISYEEAVKKSPVLQVPQDAIVKISTAEKDYENKCVKLEISY